MGRMRRIPARIRFAPRTGLRKSAVAPRRCRCGDGSRHFYNRSSAVVACALVSRGRRANPVLTYETALRRFPLCATSLYNRTSVVFAMHRTLANTNGWRFYQWGMSMVGRRFLCRIILVGIVLKLWLSVIFSMIYLSIKCFYEKMLEKLVFCC